MQNIFSKRVYVVVYGKMTSPYGYVDLIHVVLQVL
jgi:hypothetical protein